MEIKIQNVNGHIINKQIKIGLNADELLEKITEVLSSLNVEHRIFAGIDIDGNVICIESAIGYEKSVTIDLSEFMEVIKGCQEVVKIIDIHNHPKNDKAPRLYSLVPSAQDMISVKELQERMGPNYVYEHYIVSGNEIIDFSDIQADYHTLVDRYLDLQSVQIRKDFKDPNPQIQEIAKHFYKQLIYERHADFLNEALLNIKYLKNIKRY